MRMAVNLSTRQLQQRPTGRHQRYDPISLVSVALAEAGLPAEALELEVTESLFLKDPEFAMDVLGRLREMGVMIAIDDFGTGYSSLSYLKMLPARRLKIDHSFVRNLQHSERDTAIAQAIIGIAHSPK
jgi:EAL domain-containing protein (putative c-di-GMP-specific phosphodiesterase class I)